MEFLEKRYCTEHGFYKRGEGCFGCNNPNTAVSVIDEAASIYWENIKKNPEVLKRLSIHNIKQIFDDCVIPAIKKVRELDRAHKLEEIN